MTTTIKAKSPDHLISKEISVSSNFNTMTYTLLLIILFYYTHNKKNQNFPRYKILSFY